MLNILLPILIGCLACNGQAASVKFCNDDDECKMGEFCYLKTKACSSCVVCKEYQRNPSGSCAREPAQCGDCLDGFELENLTDGHTRDLCVPVSNNGSASLSVQEPLSEMNMKYVFTGTCVVVACLVALSLLLKFKKCVTIKIQQKFHPCNDSQSSSVATLYRPSAPPGSIAALDRDEAEVRMLNGFCQERDVQKFQEAGLANNPVWVRSPNFENYDENDNVENHVNNPTNHQGNQSQDSVDGPSSLDNMDEDTMPSSWTPGTEYNAQSGVSAADSMVATFQGILQLNNVTSSGSHDSAGPSGSANHTAGNNPPGPDHSRQQQHSNVMNITIINTAAFSNTEVNTNFT